MLVYFYALLSLFIGVPALWHGAVYSGISIIVGSMLCWFSASGLKGSLMVGTLSQKLFGLGAAAVAITIGIGLVYHSGVGVNLFGGHISGVMWCVVGLALGWICTTRKIATEWKQEQQRAN